MASRKTTTGWWRAKCSTCYTGTGITSHATANRWATAHRHQHYGHVVRVTKDKA